MASLTDIAGLRVGHWTHEERRTGCTVICGPPEGLLASAAFLGASPGTREGILLSPEKKMQRIHALLFTGGSAFGLAAATGVVRYLEEQGIGYETPAARIPIVPAAVIYDLMIGDARIRPDEKAGYLAASRASEAPVEQGRVGAGTGASAGKYHEPVPTGLGSACIAYQDIRVGALAVVNPVGDVYTPDGRLLAGHGRPEMLFKRTLEHTHTTLVALAVEARISKVEAFRIALAAHGAIGRVIRPSHTAWDGDAVFVLSTEKKPAVSPAMLEVLAQEAVVEAIVASVR